MKYNLVLFLPLFIGGCVNTSPERQVSVPPIERFSQPDCAAKPPSLEHYPPVDLRSDLGEYLIENDIEKEKQLVEKEKQLVLESMSAAKEVIQLRAKDKNNIGRGDHAKPLGCYDAEFTVSSRDVVRVDDQAGIARPENLGKTFPAVVRFSNSEPKNVSDYRSATMGLAIKVKLDSAKHSKNEFLFDESGEQNFIAGGFKTSVSKTFVSKNIEDYTDLFWLRIHPYSNALRIRDQHPEAFTVFGTEPLLRWFNLSSSAAPMVLEHRFSSLLPYAWGDSAVKYRFEPCHSFDRREANFSRFDSGYQAKLVSEFLQSNEICYVMKIQKRPRPGSDVEKSLIEKTFPIDNAKVYWPEPGEAKNLLSAEFREVARVKIKSASKALTDHACEHRAFNPWRGLKAHQPLGSLNRARWAVYRTSECVRKEIYPPMPEEQK
jgi:hypothetical protein